MDVATYYRHQAAARGHVTPGDVARDAQTKTRLYDAIVQPWLPPARDAQIYEVACGAGVFLHWLRGQGYTRFSGSDASEEQIALASAAGLPVKAADSLAELRAMPDGACDCLIALDFYEHLPKEVLLDFLFDARRVLAPHGCLILRGPNGASPVAGCALFNDITHFWALTPTAFRAVLGMAGFSDVQWRDDALASLQKLRWLKVPFTWAAQWLLRGLLRAATREKIECLSASFFLCARK